MLGNRWGAFSSEINKHPFLYIGTSVERGRFNIEVGVKGGTGPWHRESKFQIAMMSVARWVFLDPDTAQVLFFCEKDQPGFDKPRCC